MIAHVRGFLALMVFALISVTGLEDAKAADTYVFDKNHTQIRFVYDHLGLTKMSGRFLDFDGTVVFDKAALTKSSVSVTIKAASVATHVSALDKNLKGKDYFNIEKNPDIIFKSTSIRQTGSKTGQVLGDLTINGVTKPVTLDVVFKFSGDHPLAGFLDKYRGVKAAAFTARTRVLRSDFGMAKYTPLVSDEIDIEIETELKLKK